MHKIEEALAYLRNGKMIIVVDDEKRENEGDLVVAASSITPEQINFMITYGRGLVCLALPPSRVKAMGLPLLQRNTQEQDHYGTAFTLSIDAKTGISTGISAYDRAHTIKLAMCSAVASNDFVVPGHVFPLQAKEKGVLERRGHTEAAVDLTRLAGLEPGGVICEILNEDGTMMRLPQLQKFAHKHDLPLIKINDLIAFRRQTESIFPTTTIPTRWGNFNLLVYPDGGKEHVVLCHGKIEDIENPLIRIHSECLTGDIFGSRKCDCGDQLDESLKRIAREPAGMIIYLRQEGRGIGLTKKIQAYALQAKGFDTVEANQILGCDVDSRTYDTAVKVLRNFNIKSVRILTNNPDKVNTLREAGIKCSRSSLTIPATTENYLYQKTKIQKLGHFHHGS